MNFLGFMDHFEFILEITTHTKVKTNNLALFLVRAEEEGCKFL